MVRYGGMFAIGLAYCGTSNRSALRRLLHVAVSDVSSDVRRAAVMALGFVACNSPNQVRCGSRSSRNVLRSATLGIGLLIFCGAIMMMRGCVLMCAVFY